MKSSYQVLKEKFEQAKKERGQLLDFIRLLDKYSDKPYFDNELFKFQKKLVGDSSGHKVIVNLMKFKRGLGN